jgi:ABC-2 type transport system ATP-binding protein
LIIFPEEARMSGLVIETRDLTKQYNGFVAVERLNLSVRAGEVFGLLGPNGAGKTTTILMLLGLTEPTSGRVRVLGVDPARRPLSVKSRVGYLPEEVGFYTDLSARENLIYIAKLNGLSRELARERIEESLARVGLSDAADQPVGTFSHGMRQRLGVAEVLLKHPSLIILDEPTQGLDPERTAEFLRIIHSLKAENITILLSSHQLHQVQAVCDRVGLFHRGRMVLQGTVRELAQRVLGGGYRIRLLVEGEAEKLQGVLQKVSGVVSVHQPQRNTFEVEASDDLRAETAGAVIQAGGRLLSLEIDTPDLDQIYARYFQEVENDNHN